MNEPLKQLYHENKAQVDGLKDRLKQINEQKELWFNKKEELKTILNEKIKQIKDFKSQKDQSNLEVPKLKEERNKFNFKVKELVEKIRTLNKEKEKTYKKYDMKFSPEKIQEKIKELEQQIEIEVNYQKEKKLMEEIKKLKKIYEEVEGVIQISNEAKKINKEIDESKAKADEFHKKIQASMKDNKYSDFIALSKEITGIKKEQEVAFQKFIDYKNEFNKLNKQLKESNKPLEKTKKELNHKKMLHSIEREAKTKEILEQKTKEVEEKISKKKKITTEDLIAFQGSN